MLHWRHSVQVQPCAPAVRYQYVKAADEREKEIYCKYLATWDVYRCTLVNRMVIRQTFIFTVSL